MLRAAGVHVHRERMVDAIQAIEWIGIRSRADVRATLCALLVHRHDDLPLFNEAFDLFFRAHGSSGLNLPLFSLGERARVVTRRDAGAPQRARSRGEAASDCRGGGIRARRLQHRRGVADARTSRISPPAELEAARRLLLRMPWEPGLRRTRRWQRAVARRRSTCRGCCRSEPDARRRADRAAAPRAPRGAAADRGARRRERIDGSLQPHAACLRERTDAQRAARRELRLRDTPDARVTRHVARRWSPRRHRGWCASLHDWGGGTRIGDALRTFNTTWARRVMRHGPVVLIVSDGWDRGDPALLDRELARVRRRCSRLIWLNPLLGSAGYEPLTRGMQAALRARRRLPAGA